MGAATPLLKLKGRALGVLLLGLGGGLKSAGFAEHCAQDRPGTRKTQNGWSARTHRQPSSS